MILHGVCACSAILGICADSGAETAQSLWVRALLGFFWVEFLARDAVSGSREPGSCQFGFFSGLFFCELLIFWVFVGVMLGLCLLIFQHKMTWPK